MDGPDKQLCIIEALCNQLEDVRTAPPAEPYNWMFCEVGEDGPLLGVPALARNVRWQKGRFPTKVLGRPVTTKVLGRQATTSWSQSNAAVSTADLARCMDVTERTLPIYNEVLKETRGKVAEMMAGIVEPVMVDPATDCKLEPKAFSLLPDRPTSSNAAAPVVPNTIQNLLLPNLSSPLVPNTMRNTMLNMFLPQVSRPANAVLPNVHPTALPAAQTLNSFPHTFPLATGGYSFPVAIPGPPVFFYPVNVPGNVPANGPANVSVQEPAPR